LHSSQLEHAVQGDTLAAKTDLWGLFNIGSWSEAEVGTEVGSLTRQCIETTVLKSRGDISAARDAFNVIEADSFAFIYLGDVKKGGSRKAPLTKDFIGRLRSFTAERSEHLPLTASLNARHAQEFGDEEYASDWLSQFGAQSMRLAESWESLDADDADFYALAQLLALCGEDGINAVLFSLIRDSRIPKSLLKSLLNVIDSDFGDGALNLMYALGLNSQAKTQKLLSTLDFTTEDPPQPYVFFGTPFHLADIYWLAAARPGTSTATARKICGSIAKDASWRNFDPEYPDWD
jgi:hypothetical protein